LKEDLISITYLACSYHLL